MKPKLRAVTSLDHAAGAEAAGRSACSVEVPATTARTARQVVDLDDGAGGLLDAGGGEAGSTDVLEGEGSMNMRPAAHPYICFQCMQIYLTRCKYFSTHGGTRGGVLKLASQIFVNGLNI